MTDRILTQRDGAIATLILNKPEKLNALSLDMWQGVAEAMTDLSNDDDLRCVVLRGAGDRAFAAGADISAFEGERFDLAQTEAFHDVVSAAMRAVRDCRHPTVAMIKGVCVGGGLELATACDIRICGESSRFGVPINKIGHTITYGELKCFVELVGPGVAREVLLEGRIFGADRARETGLVNRVMPDDQVEEEAYATARRIADGAPIAARLHKKFIDRVMDPAPFTRDEILETYRAVETEDYRIGVQAFLDKKKPEFKGR
jgi:enoyl-CoA hydratase/carnithine racemase